MATWGVGQAVIAGPPVSSETVREYATKHGVCVRPLLRRVSDRVTGAVEELTIPCGSTREAVCPPCAERARRLRIQQCAEGWHLAEDPLIHRSADEPAQDGEGDDDVTGRGARRVRSTRRRTDVAALPRLPVEPRTVGRTFTAPDGTVYRPSMFVTLTLGSYGKVVPAGEDHRAPGAGAPVSPARYDYRRAAVEAMFFTQLFDRWVQNLRRCAGFVVQYFGAIEPQRRLAPHIHLAIRGAIPRQVIRAVTEATYLQLWWPPFDQPVYLDTVPWWDPETGSYRDPETGTALPTWQEALDRLDRDPDAQPAAVVRFGSQLDVKGIIAPSADADRSVRYLTKYLTKTVTDTYADTEHRDPRYEAHIDRLHQILLFLPCSPECGNWLRYGIQPRHAGSGLAPGWCVSRAHDREHLGLGGRRVQVSRAWSGKTLREHRADRATVVREVLAEAGIAAPDTNRLATAVLAEDGLPRFTWEELPVAGADYIRVVMGSVLQTLRWRREYDAAAQAAHSRASPDAA